MGHNNLGDIELRKDMENWVRSWWEEPSRPRKVEKGQIWTIFHPKGPSDKEGTMVCVFSVDADYVYVIPLHTDTDSMTGCEPILTETSLPGPVCLVAVVELGLLIPSAALEKARFIGTLKEKSMRQLTHSFFEFRKVVEALTRLQMLEASCGPDKVPEEEITKAFEAGILRLVSPKISFEELVQLHQNLQENIQPYHEEAIQTLFLEEETSGLSDKLKTVRDKIKELGKYVAPPVRQVVSAEAMQKGRGRAAPPQLPNPLEIEITVPEDGGDFLILPPKSESEHARKLKKALQYFRQERFLCAVQAWGKDAIQEEWEPATLPGSKREGIVKNIPRGTTAILVALCPDKDKDELNKALKSIHSDRPLPKGSILWVLYHPESRGK